MPFIPDEKENDLEQKQKDRILELQTGIAQEKAQVSAIQKQNRLDKVKHQTAHIPIKDLEKMNYGGKLTPVIIDRKADEKVADKMTDYMAEQKINQATRTAGETETEKIKTRFIPDNQAEQTVVDEEEDMDLVDIAAGGKITPEMEQQYPYLTAIAKTGKELVSVPSAFFNEMLMNYPKSILKKMGIDLPKAETKAGKAGEVVMGVVGGFKNPLLKVLGVGKGAMTAKKAIGTGAIFGAAYSPEDVTDVKQRVKSALLGAGISVVGEGTLKGIKALPKLRDKTAGRVVNSLIKPLQKDFSYGKNPGMGVAKEGIKANSYEDLIKKISSKKKEIGTKIENVLSKSDKKVDLLESLMPLDDTLKELNKAPRINKNVIQRVKDTRDDLIDMISKEGDNISLKNATKIKSDIGDLTRWTGNMSDDEIVNKSLKKVYSNIKNKINKEAPKVKQLNERYANMITAENATIYRDKINQRLNMISLGTRISGYGGAVVGSLISGNPIPIVFGLSTAAIDKALSTPAAKTRIASWLAKASRDEVKKSLLNNPELSRGLYRTFSKAKTGFGGKIINILNEIEEEK